MIARLLGLTAVSLAATVGSILIAANVVGVAVHVKRVRTDRHWNWDTAPGITRAFDELEAA